MIKSMTKRTAISLPAGLLSRGDKVAAELRVSRSRLVALALDEYLRRHSNSQILRALNAAYAEESQSASVDAVRRRAHRRLVQGEW